MVFLISNKLRFLIISFIAFFKLSEIFLLLNHYHTSLQVQRRLSGDLRPPSMLSRE